MTDEHAEAVALANKVLDQPWADPDDDLRTLARQFLRAEERIETGAFNALRDQDRRRQFEAALTAIDALGYGPCSLIARSALKSGTDHGD